MEITAISKHRTSKHVVKKAALACLLAIGLLGQVQANGNPKVLIETTMGEITVELFADKAPVTVANFLGYVDSGFYADTVFHRVIRNFMIQGGGYTKDMVKKPAGDSIKNESRNKLHNLRGTLAMARTDDPDSAAAQFFINVRSNLKLDFNYRSGRLGYTVFGRVESGMEVVDGISLEETGYFGNLQDVPLQPIVIKSITLLKQPIVTTQ